MEKSLTDILRDALIGKKIKLYKVLDKTIHPQNGIEYFVTQKDVLIHPKKCKIIGESFGIIQSIYTEHIEYEGDYYDIKIVDENGHQLRVNYFNSITHSVEFI